VDGDAPAALVYTSGTTGVSKGAILTHRNFAANAVNLNACWQISSADRFLLALPLFHVHALGNGLHCWLASGCRMRLLERFEHQKAPAEFLDFRPTLFFRRPDGVCAPARFPGGNRARNRRIHAAVRLRLGAAFAAGVRRIPRPKFGHTILERYGMTETLMNMSNPYAGERRAGTVGLPLPGVSARLVEGEIQLRGANIFAGYWRRGDATRAAFDDGWFKTGDMAECSADGYYTLLGRKSDLIISGGFNIYPREIEDFLTEQDEMAEAAVVGVRQIARRDSGGVHRGAPAGGRGGTGGALPGAHGVVQSAARIRDGGEAAAHGARQGAEAPAAAVAVICGAGFSLQGSRLFSTRRAEKSLGAVD
jgi:malonyl-CoA/methylmalonyl-CoA synthetase